MVLTNAQREQILSASTPEQKRIWRSALHGVLQTYNNRVSVLKAEGRITSANLNAWYAFRDSWVRWLDDVGARDNMLQLLAFYEDAGTWNVRIAGWEGASAQPTSRTSPAAALGPEGPTIQPSGGTPGAFGTAIFAVLVIGTIFGGAWWIDKTLSANEGRKRLA